MNEQLIHLRGGLRLCLCQWGPMSAGVPVVLLHGWLDQGASWDRVARALVEALGRPVLAPDQRGHGKSDPTPPGSTYHFSEYLADLDALLRVVPGPVDLVGHSMGGTVASQYAGLRPAQVRRLVLIEGLGPPESSDADAVQQLRAHLDQLQQPPVHSRLASVAAGAERLRRLQPALPVDEAERLAARVLQPHPDGAGGWIWRWDPMHRARSAVAFDVRRYRLLLAQIQAPTVLLFGAESGYGQLPDLAARIACLPHVVAHHTLPTGHSPHLEAPQHLAMHLVAALS